MIAYIGCRECSKRRIICDNSEPSCNKCQKKGIHCSGSGRIRFSGVALRGKLRDGFPSASQPQPPNLNPQKIRWKNDQPKRVRRSPKKGNIDVSESRTRQVAEDAGASTQVGPKLADDSSLDLVSASPKAIPYWIAPMDTQARMSMSYCKPLCPSLEFA